MQVHEIKYEDAAPVQGYGPGSSGSATRSTTGAIVVVPGRVSPWGGYDDVEPLLALAGGIDVLFVGTGKEIAHLPAHFRDPLEEAGIGVECMASPAACRTYNVLLSEGRRVGLALLPV